jgi:hypothetical protein
MRHAIGVITLEALKLDFLCRLTLATGDHQLTISGAIQFGAYSKSICWARYAHMQHILHIQKGVFELNYAKIQLDISRTFKNPAFD